MLCYKSNFFSKIGSKEMRVSDVSNLVISEHARTTMKEETCRENWRQPLSFQGHTVYINAIYTTTAYSQDYCILYVLFTNEEYAFNYFATIRLCCHTNDNMSCWHVEVGIMITLSLYTTHLRRNYRVSKAKLFNSLLAWPRVKKPNRENI